MFCNDCGKDLGKTKPKFCKYCGANLTNRETTSQVVPVKIQASSTVKETKKHHPWRRYFARMLDIWIVGISTGFMLGIFAPIFLEETPELALTIIIMVLMLPYDAILLSSCKTTFGKWCLGISVTDAKNLPLNFEKASTRSLLVLWRGLGLGIPLVSLFTLIHQYGVLTKKGTTSWDEELECEVHHQNLQPLKVILAIGVAIFSVYLMVLGSNA